jgi:hypothetical protein
MYRIYAGTPEDLWAKSRPKTTFDYGDATGRDYTGASAILHRLAGVYRDGYAQWYAGKLLGSAAFNEFDGSAWRNIMNFDPTVQPQNINTLPTLKEFKDSGLVMARSGWDGGASYIGFKNGPALGAFATKLVLEQGVTHGPGDMSHVHPDNNHFILAANGEILIRDDGYVQKFTNSHNTLLIDGEGQAGEGYVWFNNNGGHAVDSGVLRNDAVIEKVVSEAEYDYFAADAAKSYKTSSGLQKFKRHIIYFKNDGVVIVADDIMLNSVKPLELRFFTETQNLTLDNNTLTAVSAGNKFKIELLTPANVQMTIDPVTVSSGINASVTQRKALQMRTTASGWLNVTALRWSNPSSQPKSVTYSRDNNILTFTIDGKSVILNLEDNSIL